jgi:hypothetical protein
MTNETKLIKVSDSKHPITIDADATKVVAASVTSSSRTRATGPAFGWPTAARGND